ncbi:ABC transporter permease [Candidatus Woesearchaeota archaeon]|nr:ABC transporter permease [Candidatus Woesearchaeota archaeon]
MKIIKKELMDILQEKSFVSTLFMQLFLIAFYTFAIMGILAVFSPTGHSISLQVISNQDLTDLKEILSENSRIRPYYTTTEDMAFDNHDAVLYIEKGSTTEMKLHVLSPRSTYITSEIKKSLQQYESLLRKKSGLPALEINTILRENDINRLASVSITYEFTYLVIIPLLIFLPIYLSGVLFIDLLTEEQKRKTLDILRTAPVSYLSIITQKVTAALIISFLQILAWVLLVTTRGIHISNIPLLLLFAFIFNILLVLLAALITVIFKDRVNSHILYTIIYVIIVLTKDLPINPLSIITKLAMG